MIRILGYLKTPSETLLKDVSHAEAGKFYYYARPNYTFGVKYYGT
jgi:hypothetical protein